MFKAEKELHENHKQVILKNLWYDRWIHRDHLQVATQSKNLSARISQCRELIPEGSTIICYKKREKKFLKMIGIVTDTYYALIAWDLLDNPKQTTYDTWNIPPRVLELLWEPKKPRFRKYFFK